MGNSSVEIPAVKDKVGTTGAGLDSANAPSTELPESKVTMVGNAASTDQKNSADSSSSIVNGVLVKGGWDELPHNMGTLSAKPNDAISGDKSGDKPAKAAKKRTPVKPKDEKNAPAKASDPANEDQDAAGGVANEAADVPAKAAPKKRAPRKKAAAKEAQDEDVEMEDVMQDAAKASDAKPAPKTRAARRQAASKAAPAQDESAAETEADADHDASHEKVQGDSASAAKPTPKKRAPSKNKSAEPAPVKMDEDATPENEDGNDADVGRAAKLAPVTAAKCAAPKKKAFKDEIKSEDGVEDIKDPAAATAPKTPKPRAPLKKAIQQPSPAERVGGGDDAAVKNETPRVTITRKRVKKEDGGESDFEEQKPKRKRATRAKKVDTSDDVVNQVNKLIDSVEGEAKMKKPKAAKYGITPGVSPYPDWPLPTAEACYEVNKLLSDVHGVVEQPKTIPPPSLEITGCGEVPSVLDALIRTRLSAATTSTNSGYAFAGLVEKFGIMDSGIGKGSINWNKVREADEKVIEEAIKRGGLAKTKSVSIKGILEMVHEQNIARREAFRKEKEEGVKAEVVGADSLPQSIKDLEIAAADQDVLSLQYMHGLTAEEAMNELTKFPGIGVKTASCVILFCLRRPSFAVDTHVFRLCKWLKWIPENATRDKTFSHCEVRIPHELKYSLHQLFIRHGKTCGRCRAATGVSSEAWENANCPIEHLLTRTGERKMFKATPKTSKKKGKKSKKGDDEDTESELSEHDGDEFEDLLSE